jgi:hypothetical protein
VPSEDAQLRSSLSNIVDGRVLSSDVVRTAPQLSISQKALGTLPEDGNIMPESRCALRLWYVELFVSIEARLMS